MPKITQRNFHNYISVIGSFEFQELGHAYNYMLDEINDDQSDSVRRTDTGEFFHLAGLNGLPCAQADDSAVH
ncbi:hypothetical protein B9T62_08645 [Paenibacillus donghaensis]|uniref:Uncharacterized protein n=1 Tax=Paenibacillus donghaensis TaxID=414771 RepID=A0A2Z2KIW4_9BACL|nr:hypothetical protein B9T62_08645 [Paenibacillus donghaensis]